MSEKFENRFFSNSLYCSINNEIFYCLIGAKQTVPRKTENDEQSK